MFRDLVWITSDYSIRAQDGLIIFKWWLPYVPKDVRKEDCSNLDTRVYSLFNGFELHIFNRSQTYHRLEKIFKFDTSRLFPKDDGFFSDDNSDHSDDGHEDLEDPKDTDPFTKRPKKKAKNNG